MAWITVLVTVAVVHVSGNSTMSIEAHRAIEARHTTGKVALVV